ncbi:MAG: hypothetical protein AAF939_11285 [Planctomycetota bacterium]
MNRYFWTLIVLATVLVSKGVGQETPTENTDLQGLIQKIESVGGRIFRISAADENQEVNFALAGKQVGDKEIAELGRLKNVIWLNLANTEITDEGLGAIASLPLTKLHLEKTKIGDEGLKHLLNMKQLEYLNLYDTQVTDQGIQQLEKLPSLKKLYVWKSKVTPVGMDQLKKAKPDLEIVGALKMKIIEPPAKKKSDQKEDTKKKAAGKPEGDKKGGKKEKSGQKKSAVDQSPNQPKPPSKHPAGEPPDPNTTPPPVMISRLSVSSGF